VRPRRRPPTEEQRRKLTTTGGALAALSQHPSWPDLVAEIEAKKERIERSQLRKTMSILPVDQREIDFSRGFIAGMQYMAMIPQNAESRLEAYLKEFGIEAEEGAVK
jgi:hypothetical protein